MVGAFPLTDAVIGIILLGSKPASMARTLPAALNPNAVHQVILIFKLTYHVL